MRNNVSLLGFTFDQYIIDLAFGGKRRDLSVLPVILPLFHSGIFESRFDVFLKIQYSQYDTVLKSITG